MSDLHIKQLQATIEKQEKIIDELKSIIERGEHDSLWKIRHKETGLFASGGLYYSFNSKGKTWTKRGVISHLRQYINRYRSNAEKAVDYFENCEVIEIITIERTTKQVKDFIKENDKINTL